MTDNHIIDFKYALKRENLKFTNQRYSVFKFFIDNKGHFDCDMIIEKLNKKYQIKVSRATTYRTLDLLVKYDFIKKIIFDDNVAKYESKVDYVHHDHMICLDTGRIIEFTCLEIEDMQDEIAKKHGYKVIKHVHHLFVKPVK